MAHAVGAALKVILQTRPGVLILCGEGMYIPSRATSVTWFLVVWGLETDRMSSRPRRGGHSPRTK